MPHTLTPQELTVIIEDQLVFVDNHFICPIKNEWSALDFLRSLSQSRDFSKLEDPFYVFNLSCLLAQHEKWLRFLPRVEPFYAVKCNNHPVLMRLLSSLGCGFDCASKAEINTAISVGAEIDKVIYAHPCKNIDSLEHAKQLGVRMMTFDKECELRKIMNIYPKSELVLRIAISDPNALWLLNNKFGCQPKFAPKLLELAASLGANIVGICFHVGSGCRNPSAYADGIANAKLLFDLGTKLGFNMSLLDIGGGYSGTGCKDGHPTFEKIAEIINKALDTYFPLKTNGHVRVIAEPGRFYCADAFTLCTTVLSKVKVPTQVVKNGEDEKKVDFMYYINNGMYGSLRTAIYEGVKAAPLKLQPPGSPLYPSTIWGPCLDNTDVVHQNILFPELNEGNPVVFENAGAYTFVLASQFHDFPRPKFVLIAEKRHLETIMALYTKEYTPARERNGYQNVKAEMEY